MIDDILDRYHAAVHALHMEAQGLSHMAPRTMDPHDPARIAMCAARKAEQRQRAIAAGLLPEEMP